ncbi:50S ribosomal protein L3 [candidate division WOR-3 bacterium]|nr:50S ribosomal protein L3 [candidate division WOR-3 bacterium]
MIGLVGIKGEMTQIYDDAGKVVPVTEIKVGKCVVVGLRTREKHGYFAVQIGQGEPSKRQLTKPYEGQFKKAGVPVLGKVCEFRVDSVEGYQIGQELKVDIFQPGEFVNVTGWTKGRGFAGGMKRWGWHGGPASHGSMSHRRIGSLGAGSSPGRALPGRTLPGHYGCERVTIKNLKVVKVDPEQGVIYVRGAVPGYRGARVLIRKGA